MKREVESKSKTDTEQTTKRTRRREVVSRKHGDRSKDARQGQNTSTKPEERGKRRNGGRSEAKRRVVV